MRHLTDAMNIPTTGPNWWNFDNPALKCPNDASQSSGGYAYNNKYLGGWLQEYNSALKVPFIDQITLPTETIFTYDGPDSFAGTGNSWLGYFGVPPSDGVECVGNRHFGSINSAWVDGHVSYHKRNFFLIRKNSNQDYYWFDDK
jgi:prepilin-type processing-associated H-X9-DG protein